MSIKDPVTWAEVHDEFDDFLDEENNNDDIENYLEDLDDPLGLKKASYRAKRRGGKEQEGSGRKWDLSSENFDATLYLATEFSDTPIEDLIKGLEVLEKKKNRRQEQLKDLVQQNFNRFVGCKDALDEMYLRLQNNQDQVQINTLASDLKTQKSTASSTFASLIARQNEIDNIRSVLSILTRVKFKFIFSLPTMMKNDMDKKEYDKVVFHYKKVVVWLANTQVSMFKKVLLQAQKIIEELQQTLVSNLVSKPIKLEEEEKIIRLLVSLHSPLREEEDPAWYCLKSHHKKIIELLNKAVKSTGDGFSSSNFHGYAFETDLNAWDSKTTNPKNTIHESHACQTIRRLCSIIQELLPDFWSMAKSFYNGEYHTGFSDKEMERLQQKYGEAQFSKLFQSIMDTFVRGVRLHFFGSESGSAGGVGGSGRGSIGEVGTLNRSTGSRKRQPTYMQTLRKRSSNRGSFSIREWEHDKKSDTRNNKKVDKYSPQQDDEEILNSNRGTLHESMEEAEDNDKEKLKAVIECAKVLRNLKISWEFSGSFFQLLDEMVTCFLQDTFSWTLNELRRLYLLENWEIADRTWMVTSLPYHYVTLVKKVLTELKGVVETEDEVILREIEKNFSECLNSFADNMHFFAFENFQQNMSTSDMENGYDDNRNLNSRLLIILNNCNTIRVRHVPELVKKYRAIFKNTLTTPNSNTNPNLPTPVTSSSNYQSDSALGGPQDPLIDATNSLIEQLERMVLDKYLKSKITLISTRIKSGLLLEGFDLARDQLFQGGIRDYVIDTLVHLVFVHEELHRLSPPLVPKILSILLEYIYESFIDWLKYVDEWSVYGRFQVGMELQFIHQITDNYKSLYSNKLYSELQGILNLNIFTGSPVAAGGEGGELPASLRNTAKQIIDDKLKTSFFLFECFFSKQANE